jgi:hypothetical protein
MDQHPFRMLRMPTPSELLKTICPYTCAPSHQQANPFRISRKPTLSGYSSSATENPWGTSPGVGGEWGCGLSVTTMMPALSLLCRIRARPGKMRIRIGHSQPWPNWDVQKFRVDQMLPACLCVVVLPGKRGDLLYEYCGQTGRPTV